MTISVLRRRAFSLAFVLFPASLFAQSLTSVALPSALDKTIQSLGGRPPGDAVLVGSVTITAGSTKEDGTVRIVTKGATHSAEIFDTPTTSQHIVFANGFGAETKKTVLKEMPFGRMLSAHSALSPVSFLAARLADPAVQVEDLGERPNSGKTSHLFKVSNAWSKDKNLAVYQEFSACDVWLDPATSLPQTITYGQRDGIGPIPWLAIRVDYEDYRTVGGHVYPFHITKYVNGTKWADITLTSVEINVGVKGEEFQVPAYVRGAR